MADPKEDQKVETNRDNEGQPTARHRSNSSSYQQQQQDNNNTNNSKPSTSSGECMFDTTTRNVNLNEFMGKLNNWVWECQQWRQFHSLYPSLVYYNHNNNRIQQPNVVNNQQRRGGTTDDGGASRAGSVYKVGRIWKRLVAEMIDCALLLVLKLVLIAMLLTEFVQLQDLEDLKMILMEDDVENISTLMYEHRDHMLTLAVIHRTVVTLYEAYSLYAYPNPNIGGATIGKMIVGLKVVSCTSAEDLGNGYIRVYPAGNIGFSRSLLRAFLKNSMFLFLIPSGFSILGSPFNQTTYDTISGCIVVESASVRNF